MVESFNPRFFYVVKKKRTLCSNRTKRTYVLWDIPNFFCLLILFIITEHYNCPVGRKILRMRLYEANTLGAWTRLGRDNGRICIRDKRREEEKRQEQRQKSVE